MKHMVIGSGEVGVAIYAVLKPFDPHLRDIQDSPYGPDTADVLHICFPWSVDFDANVRSYEDRYQSRLTIVHSTVPVGTCDRLGVVHSPVTGKHPRLAESVQTFTKFFGGARANEAAKPFAEVGIETQTTPLAATTEAGKLWELTQYGLAIVIEKAIHVYCEERGIDFEVAYQQMAESYNDGYQVLGMPQFTRPIIQHIPGPIGGHCVLPGAAMLGHWVGDLVVAEGSAKQIEAVA